MINDNFEMLLLRYFFVLVPTLWEKFRSKFHRKKKKLHNVCNSSGFINKSSRVNSPLDREPAPAIATIDPRLVGTIARYFSSDVSIFSPIDDDATRSSVIATRVMQDNEEEEEEEETHETKRDGGIMRSSVAFQPQFLAVPASKSPAIDFKRL